MSLRPTGSTEPRSPVSRNVINYTYIDRNNIHYSWASQRQSYFPPFQHDEKILNNRPPSQTSAFQRSRLTLKGLKSKLLSYQGITVRDQHVSNGWWLCGFRGLCFCFVFVLTAKAGAFRPFRWSYSVHLDWTGGLTRIEFHLTPVQESGLLVFSHFFKSERKIWVSL